MYYQRKPLIKIIAVLFLLGIGFMTKTAFAQVPEEVSIVSQSSGKCLDLSLDVTGSSQDDGAIILQWRCHGGSNQLWRVELVNNNYYKIVSQNSGKCLDVTGYSQDDGAIIQQYTCHGGPNQLWELVPVNNNYYKIVSQNSGKCLDVTGYSQDDGAIIQQYTCHGGPNQLWELVPVNIEFVQSAIMPGIPIDDAHFNVKQFEGIVSLSISGSGCTGTFIHPRFILTAAHCLPQCPAPLANACWLGGNPAVGEWWIGQDGKPSYSAKANDGATATKGASYTVDYVYFPQKEGEAPDVALLRTTKAFTGTIIPLMHFLNMPTPENLCMRYEETWPFIFGYSNNNDPVLTPRVRTGGRSEVKCVFRPFLGRRPESERFFYLESSEEVVGSVHSCKGDSGGPVIWEDGFGGFAVGGVISTGTGCPIRAGTTGVAFVPGSFLADIKNKDPLCTEVGCAAPATHYGGLRLAYWFTRIDRCSDSLISTYNKSATSITVLPPIQKGRTVGFNPLIAGNSFLWLCGQSGEITYDIPFETNYIVVRRGLIGRKIIWDAHIPY